MKSHPTSFSPACVHTPSVQSKFCFVSALHFTDRGGSCLFTRKQTAMQEWQSSNSGARVKLEEELRNNQKFAFWRVWFNSILAVIQAEYHSSSSRLLTSYVLREKGCTLSDWTNSVGSLWRHDKRAGLLIPPKIALITTWPWHHTD